MVCPVNGRTKFGRMHSRGVVQPWNLFEVECRNCRRKARDEDGREVWVLHRYNLLGQHVETVEEPRVSDS
jgi:hypothetical protein